MRCALLLEDQNGGVMVEGRVENSDGPEVPSQALRLLQLCEYFVERLVNDTAYRDQVLSEEIAMRKARPAPAVAEAAANDTLQ